LIEIQEKVRKQAAMTVADKAPAAQSRLDFACWFLFRFDVVLWFGTGKKPKRTLCGYHLVLPGKGNDAGGAL